VDWTDSCSEHRKRQDLPLIERTHQRAEIRTSITRASRLLDALTGVSAFDGQLTEAVGNVLNADRLGSLHPRSRRLCGRQTL